MESFCCIMDILKHNNKNYKIPYPKLSLLINFIASENFYLEQLHIDPKYTFSTA